MAILSGKLDNYVPPVKLQDATGSAKSKSHGFTLVDEYGQNVTLGNRLRTTAEIFDIISNETSTDHPLCEVGTKKDQKSFIKSVLHFKIHFAGMYR